MKRSSVISLVCVLTLLSARCKAPERPTDGTSGGGGGAAAMVPISSVAGVVVFEPEGTSETIWMADFSVTLKRGGNHSSPAAKTDVSGHYRFSDVAPGKYSVCWDAAGWQPGCTQEVEIKKGQSATPQPVELKPASLDGVVWGSVLLADGSPAAMIDANGAITGTPSVEILGNDNNAVARGRTDLAGNFAIATQGGGAATVRAAIGKVQTDLKLSEKVEPGRGRILKLNNHRPVISTVTVARVSGPGSLMPGDTVTLHPHVTDADGDPLQMKWAASAGSITSTPDGVATWKVPPYAALATAYVTISDAKGGLSQKTLALNIGSIVSPAHYPIEINGGPPTCHALSLSNVPPPSGYPTSVPFLTRLDTGDHSAAYYAAVDPQNKRSTLGAWWQVAGFNATNGSGGVAKTAYLNFNDLGFGRDMHFNQVGSNIYAWVTNYGCYDNNPTNADLAKNPIPANALATVCMEFAAIEGQTTQLVKFFVYSGGVASSPRVGKADLDGHGLKAVPNLCQECHGSNSGYNGGTNVNLGSSFIPFDLALLRYPPGGTKTPPTSDLPVYFTMNQLVKATNPTAAITNLINGWYATSSTIQNNNYLPVGWPANTSQLYQNVIVPGCRTCHYSFSGINWDTYSTTASYRSLINTDVCKSSKVMPHATLTYINFWTNPYPLTPSPSQTLATFTDGTGGVWPAIGTCQ